MRVLVVGGTGFIGTELTTELYARGHDVTALARTPEDAVLPGGVQTVAGDVTDPNTIDDAFAEQDAVVNLVALSPLFTPRGGNEMHERVHLDGTRNVVAAAEANGVGRFVQLSALGADPEGETAYIRAKGRAEQVVRDSSLDWVLVRPSVVFGEGGEFLSFTKTLTTPYVTGLPGGGKTRFQPVWAGDLVPMLADAIEDDAHVGQTYEIGGPVVLTLADVARLAYRAEGKSLTILPVPMVLAGFGLTVLGAVPGFPMGPDQYRSLTFDNTVAKNDVRAFGRDPGTLRTLSTYLGVETASSATTSKPTTPSSDSSASRSSPAESDTSTR
ncbi:MAG: complex I NDUFA9 subunit family protein [Halobacteriota archaeon]